MGRIIPLLLAIILQVQGWAQIKALVGGTLIDGYGGTPLRNSVIIIEGERIKTIGQIGQVQIPVGAEIFH